MLSALLPQIKSGYKEGREKVMDVGGGGLLGSLPKEGWAPQARQHLSSYDDSSSVILHKNERVNEWNRISPETDSNTQESLAWDTDGIANQ